MNQQSTPPNGPTVEERREFATTCFLPNGDFDAKKFVSWLEATSTQTTSLSKDDR